MEFNILMTDLDIKVVEEIADISSVIDGGEDEQYKYIHQFENMIQKLESYQIVFELKDITVLQYLMIANIKRLNVELEIDYNNPRFKILDIEKEELQDRFIEQIELTKELISKVSDECKPYLSTTGQLCNIKVYTNGKKLLKLLGTMMKYDELSEIVDCMVERDTEDNLISNLLYLSNKVDTYEIYLREMLDYELRQKLLHSLDGIAVEFQTDLTVLDKLQTNGGDIGELATTSFMKSSLIGYTEMIRKGLSDRLRMENPWHVFNRGKVTVDIAMPCQLYDDDEDFSYRVNIMISEWLGLIEEVLEIENDNKDVLAMIPMSFCVLYRYITKYKNDLNSTEYDFDLIEAGEIQIVRKQKIIEDLQKTRNKK